LITGGPPQIKVRIVLRSDRC